MIQSLENMVNALMRVTFGGLAEVRTYTNEGADLVIATATFTWEQTELARAHTRGTGAFVNAFKERVSGSRYEWERRIVAKAEEAARPFSWKAARRCGRHKRPAK